MNSCSTSREVPVLISSFVLAVLAYGILCYGVLFKGAVQPLSSILLWFALDGLAAWTAYRSGGNWLLAAGYTLGCLAAVLASIYKGHTAFVKSDLWVTMTVIVCVVVWLSVGNLAGLVASSTAMFIAGVPAMIYYAKQPQDGQLAVWLIFCLANAIGLAGRQGDALEDWIFPVLALAGSGIVTILIARKLVPVGPVG